MTIEAPGWGEAGTIRHAEEIGHTVWLEEHPRPLSTVPDELCHTRGCFRHKHPVYEQHATAAGRPFFSGETP